MESSELPQDATGDALRRVIAHGSDLAKPMKIDFHLDVPSPEVGETVAVDARRLGFDVDIYGDDSEGWTVECSRTMLATHADITQLEEQLDAIARPHGGHADGWGTFGNADSKDPSQRPKPDDEAQQTAEPLKAEDRERLEAQRKWVRNHYAEDAEERYGTVKGKLALLATILREDWIDPTDTVKLQCLGVTLGDALAQERGLEWVMVEDEHGRDPALRLGGTSVLLFPMTMISKRIERGETVDVYDLFGGVLKGIERASSEAD